MSVYVLIAVDDEDAAKRMARHLLDEKEISFTEGEFLIHTPAVLHGVWKRPTVFCECKNNNMGYTRGKKYAWFVCARCGKPHRLAAAGGGWWVALGTNLIPEELRPPGQYDHKSWKSPMSWTFLLPETPTEEPVPQGETFT
jgi:hypothetical protein